MLHGNTGGAFTINTATGQITVAATLDRETLDTYDFHYVMLTGTIIMVVFLHVLSVRSGLLALYAGIVVYVFFETLAKHGVKRMLLTLCLISLLPIGMYMVSPTLRNKIDYMVRDVSRFKDGKNVNNYSDGNRLLSWQLAWEIGNLKGFWKRKAAPEPILPKVICPGLRSPMRQLS